MSDDVWNRVDQELTRRRKAHLLPGTWAELGRRIDASAQKMTNWKTRGVPPREYAAIAQALGWSVDQLLGLAGETTDVGVIESRTEPALAPPPVPPSDFRDRREVSDSDWGILEDVKLVLDKDELARIHERAEMLRRHARDWWESNIAAPAAAKTTVAPGEAKVPSPLRPSQAKPAAAKKGAAK